MSILGWIVVGLAVSAVVRAALIGVTIRGSAPTFALGVAGALAGGALGAALFHTGWSRFYSPNTWVLALLCSVLALFGQRLLRRSSRRRH